MSELDSVVFDFKISMAHRFSLCAVIEGRVVIPFFVVRRHENI